MSILIAAILAVTPVPHEIREDQVIIHQASSLVAPCREMAEAYFDRQDIATYQWTASHKSRGNTFFVDGRLRLEGGEEVQVSCWLPRGHRLGGMRLEIGERG